MKLVFEPSGTHVKQNIHTGDKFLKVRVDFYPEETEKTYELHRVYVPIFPENGYPGRVDTDGSPVDQAEYDEWEDSLTHIWRVNPAICCFFNVPENIREADFLHELDVRFRPDDIAAMDSFMILPDSAHYASSFNKTRLKLTDQKVITSDIEDLKASINQKFANILDVKPSSGISRDIQPQSIDMGSSVIDRTYNTSLVQRCEVAAENPANADGTIDTVQVWVYSYSYYCQFGTVSMSGNNATIRDYEYVGAITSGSEQTFSSLDIDVVTGDYLGVDAANSGVLERDSSGSGYWLSGEGSNVLLDDLSSTALTWYASRTVSLYATGTEGGGGETVELAGLSSGVASVSGATKILRELIGAASGVALVSGAVKGIRKIAGTVAGQASMSGALTILGTILLAGASNGVASVAGSIKILMKLASAITGQASVSGTLKKIVSITGLTSGVASVIGAIAVFKRLIGATSGVASVSGILKKTITILATSSGSSLVSGGIKLIRKIAGISQGVASVFGRLYSEISPTRFFITLGSKSRLFIITASKSRLFLNIARKSRTFIFLKGGGHG